MNCINIYEFFTEKMVCVWINTVFLLDNNNNIYLKINIQKSLILIHFNMTVYMLCIRYVCFIFIIVLLWISSLSINIYYLYYNQHPPLNVFLNIFVLFQIYVHIGDLCIVIQLWVITFFVKSFIHKTQEKT